jgi:hypothetical protein
VTLTATKTRSRKRTAEIEGRCNFERPDGSRCKHRAGFRTEHENIGHCYQHGGQLAQKVRRATTKLLGEPMEINPLDGLLWCIRLSAGEVQFYNEQLATLKQSDWLEDSIMGRQLNIWARHRETALNRLATYSKWAIDAGIAERAVRMTEMYGQMMANLIRGVLDELDLTPDQQARMPAIVRRQLALVEANNLTTHQTSDHLLVKGADPETIDITPTS